MPQVHVNLGERRYDILINNGLLERLGLLMGEALPKVRRALIVTDSNVGALYGARAKQALEQAGIETQITTVPAGEASKSLAQANELYTACVNAGLERSSAIVALGGGVVGDLAGFVAATYLRGIPFVQVPTTLLAQVDSSIGGKTGVDLPQGKNLVGAFHQPSLVVSDLDVLSTLPRREVSAGLAEVVKSAVIRDAGFLRDLERDAAAIMALDPIVMARVVEITCRIKAQVVAADEREGGLRAILNFGHTVGHALEAYVGLGNWLHGECVAVGMVAAAAISREVRVLNDPELPGRIERLLEGFGLPTRLPVGVDRSTLEPLMTRDKKVAAGRINWVLPVRTGVATVTPDVSTEAIDAALESLRR